VEVPVGLPLDGGIRTSDAPLRTVQRGLAR